MTYPAFQYAQNPNLTNALRSSQMKVGYSIFPGAKEHLFSYYRLKQIHTVSCKEVSDHKLILGTHIKSLKYSYSYLWVYFQE
jgi:hypothetical protein